MVEKLVPDGIKLLLVGQLTVISFLGCIVLVIKSIAWLLGLFEKQPQVVVYSEPVPDTEDEDASAAAAIAAAIHKSRTSG